MSKHRDKMLYLLGIIYVVYWGINFFHNAVLTHDYSWLLWYSSTGFLLTGIALITQNIRLIYSLFCALFVIESLWIVDFIFAISKHLTLIGLTGYIYVPTFHITDLYLTLYHVLVPTGLFIAVRRIQVVYTRGWLGAVIFATTLAILTYFLTNQNSQVNCIHSVNECHTIFSFLYRITNPYRTIIALVGLTVGIFIPTNFLLIHYKKRKIQKQDISFSYNEKTQ